MRALGLTFFLTASSLVTFSQVDDNTAAYNDNTGPSYLKIHYDNDFFTNADWYYTQGISVELVHPFVSRFPLKKLLLRPANTGIRFGISGNTFGYTPTSIGSDQVLVGDRPYAGAAFARIFAIALDEAKKMRLSSGLSLGMIGPATGMEGMQKGIHRWLDNEQPRGWQYQVRNDIIINYQVDLEKQLLQFRNNLVLAATAQIRAGSLSDKAGAGVTLIVANFANPFQVQRKQRRFRYYLFAAPLVSLVGYDATLQGGMFNRNSPYTISAADISRVTFQSNLGAVVDLKFIVLEYRQSWLSREFRTALPNHRWGGIKLGFPLK